MAPMLSENWKKLQATLKKNDPSPKTAATTSTKRKRNPTEQPPDRPKSKKPKMGLMQSTPTAEAPPTKSSASLALWAQDNDISVRDLTEAYGVQPKDTTVKPSGPEEINGRLYPGVEAGKYVAMDCEMVGVGGEEDRSVLARVSVVNFHGALLYDSFVRPKEFVTDWRTKYSGVSPKHMATARSFEDVQKDITNILKDRILVGHAVKNDLEVLFLSHPKIDIRDTSKFSAFRNPKFGAGKTPKLQTLAKEVLGIEIQSGEHSSIEDARATMLLFRRYKEGFDLEHAQRFPQKPTANGAGQASRPKKKKKKNKR